MILLIDNYDSFSYNLYQLIGGINPDIRVIRNDVCLGHQAICETFGAEITYAKKLMHGKKSVTTLDTSSRLFRGLPEKCEVARYHSLAASEEGFPECLKVTARTDDGEIMAVEHRDYPIFGVQFHPESILTTDGRKMAENFLEVTL